MSTSQDRSDIALLHRRAGFGLTGAELDQLAPAGYEAAMSQMLQGLGAPDPAGDAVPVPQFPDVASLLPQGGAADPSARQQYNKDERAALLSLEDWWLDRMIATSTPLREKLTLFWHGHFATGASKVRDAKLMYLQNDLFRRLGSSGFEALTQAVAKDGAMMVWLDTNSDKKAHPNENFARELMELFTIGIGNYTQDDVTAGARAFTGWTYQRLQYQFLLRPAQHDDGTKTFLGRTGDLGGEDVISILANRPESARFILAKLWSHFAYPVAPTDPVVSDLTSAYGSGLDLHAALQAVFLHPQFRSALTRTGLVKQPAEYLAGAARALGLSSTQAGGNGASLSRISAALGQQLFDPPNVGGWGQNLYWLDTATSQLRLQAASLLARRAQAPLQQISSEPASDRPAAVAYLLGLDGWGQTTQAALAQVASRPDQLLALALCAPEYVVA